MTVILQIILDFYTIVIDVALRISPTTDHYWFIHICNFLAIIFTVIFITCIIYRLFEKIKSLRRILITANCAFGLLSLLLLDGAPFLPKITPSFTHEHNSNIVIKPNKKQLYANDSNVNWSFEYINYPFVYELSTNKFNDRDVQDVIGDDNLIYGDLIGYKGDSKIEVNARLLKENIHIAKTENAKKYPKYTSYKITKIETRDGSLIETVYHKSSKFEFKELYLEVIADVQPDKLDEAKKDAKEQQNKKDINKLLN